MSTGQRISAGAPGLIVTLMICVAVIALAARWTFSSDQHEDTSIDAKHGAITAVAPEVESLEQDSFPIRILTVSLNDDLFPEAAPEQEPAAPKAIRLEIDLIAITDVDDVRSIFAFDRTAKEYFTATAGDTIPSGATVIAIEEGVVLFDVSGGQARLELQP